eukprot:TRINITY_DN12434_c0_g4_i1.p1 TRINITY_DN12434_c0_g4~~TRINITY_DN12434_c0_g4_i1.p1  ORF type:complete len:158 (-),score=17.60 TRINITY_DN12434_c0_g4_i1:361-834(-)
MAVHCGAVVCGGLAISLFLGLTIFGIVNLVSVSASNYQAETCFVVERDSHQNQKKTILDYKVALGSSDGPVYEFSIQQSMDTFFKVGEKFEPCFSIRDDDGEILNVTGKSAGESFTGFLILTLINGCCLAGACVRLLAWARKELCGSRSSYEESSQS